MTEEDVRALLRLACDKAGSQRAFARKHKLSAAYVSDVIRGSRTPAHSICKALGLTRAVRYLVEYRKHGKAG